MGAEQRLQRNANQEEFNTKLGALQAAVKLEREADSHELVLALSSQSGLPAKLLQRLRERLQSEIGSLPTEIVAWIKWTLDWLSSDDEARKVLLHEVARGIAGATGRKKDGEVTAVALTDISPGVIAWVKGEPLRIIEEKLGGDPDSDSNTRRICPRARELVGTVIPRGLSFIAGIISRIVEDLDPFDQQETLDRDVVGSLSAAIRKGFDTKEKLQYAIEHNHLLGRVQAHAAWANEHTDTA